MVAVRPVELVILCGIVLLLALLIGAGVLIFALVTANTRRRNTP